MSQFKIVLACSSYCFRKRVPARVLVILLFRFCSLCDISCFCAVAALSSHNHYYSILPKSRVLLCVFCGQKDSVQRIFVKKGFLFTVGSVCRVKQFTTGSTNCHLCGKFFADEEEVETVVRKAAP
jgi:hypothetical protein